MSPNVRLKRWLKNAWSNGLLMGGLILLIAIVIAWSKTLGR